MIRVVIDTNWWISFVINPSRSQLTNLLLRNDIVICASAELIAEVNTTIQYPKLAKYIKPDVIKEFIEIFPQTVQIFPIVTKVEICRDVKDNFLLSLSKDVNADFLITADNDLLVLNQFENTRILTLSEFINLGY